MLILQHFNNIQLRAYHITLRLQNHYFMINISQKWSLGGMALERKKDKKYELDSCDTRCLHFH